MIADKSPSLKSSNLNYISQRNTYKGLTSKDPMQVNYLLKRLNSKKFDPYNLRPRNEYGQRKGLVKNSKDKIYKFNTSDELVLDLCGYNKNPETVFKSISNGLDSERSDNKSSKGKTKSNKRPKVIPNITKVIAYGLNKSDFRTIKKPNNRGASNLIYSQRFVKKTDMNQVLCILLGLEKYGKYENRFNLFGGKFEEEKGDRDIHDTAVRELKEEYGPVILKRIIWCGSPWAFNMSAIEFCYLKSDFDISKSFRENDEMREAGWFPVNNILMGIKKGTGKDQCWIVKDINGDEKPISLYASGVVNAAYKNGHFI